MQSYPFQFTPAFSQKPFSSAGDLFVYESGVASGDNRIRVMPAGGGEIILKPGQSFRITKPTDVWYVQAFDSASTITGNFNIGSGDFKDSATSTSQVTIVNNNSQPIPVTAPVAIPVITSNLALNTLYELAVVTVGTVAVNFISDPTIKRAIFRNSGAVGNIALGSATVTFAKSAIVLAPGDIWIEDQSASAYWYAIADTPNCSLSISYAK